MAQIVYILGAGASREAGAPLMHDFLDVADRIWKEGAAEEKHAHFQNVFRAIGSLQQVHSKAQLDLTNIEPIFSTLEMAAILNTLPGRSAEEIPSVIESLKELIAQTLEKTILFPVRRNNVLAPPPYDQFCDLLQHTPKTGINKKSVAVITFNYDMACDFAMYKAGLGPRYALGKDPNGLLLLKLHGSLNWAACSTCSEIIPWHLDEYRKKYWWNNIFDEMTGASLSISQRIGELKHCDKTVRPQPVLVPPTWNKSEYHQDIAKVWSQAAKELSEAESIYVIGYSLPESDAFFRYLYALGTVGQSPLKKFSVYNPDPTGTVEKRFQAMLGPGALARYNYVRQTFSDAISTIKNEMN